ncbi:MAG: calcium/sodium antiporter [Thermoplasmatota archaeon]
MITGMAVWTFSLVVGVIILVKGADVLVEGGGKTAAYFGVPAIVIGLTLVSFGTSLPELASSLNAISKGKEGISLGNVIGSNIANILLVLGVSTLIKPISVERVIIKREVPIMFAAMALLMALSSGFVIERWEGMVFLVGFVAYILFFLWIAIKSDERALIKEEIENEDYARADDYDPKINISKIVIGILAVIIGSELMIRGAIFYVTEFGLSEGVVGLSIVALGTSLPELAASGMAAYRGESDISVGNVIGSNSFNILMVIGICAVISPLTFSPEILPNMMIMIAVSVMLTIFMYTGKRLCRLEGGVMLAGYFIYLAYLFLS